MSFTLEDSIVGSLVGMAVGDALGLPRENLSARRAERLFPDLDRFYFLFHHGMFSDDTEHACMTAQSLLVSGGEPRRFATSLGWRLRWWLLGCPLGAGKATLKACLKLWLGWSPAHSGVWSAGNGPAMRAPILGIAYGHLPDRLRDLVRTSTRITHSDPKAEWGALMIAQAAYLASRSAGQPLQVREVVQSLTSVLPAGAVKPSSWLPQIVQSIEAKESTVAFAHSLGLERGVTGYIYHTVPVVLHAWLSNPDDFRAAIHTVVRCGGDTDTTAALVGAIAGARLGKLAIPENWRKGLCEWPRDLRWIERLGRTLAANVNAGTTRRSVPLNFVGVLGRNLLFNLVVLKHVFRRLLPP